MQHSCTFADAPTSKQRIRMEVNRDGIHQVLERRSEMHGVTCWVRELGEPPTIRNEAELVDKLYQGAGSHAYMKALLKAWADVIRLRGGTGARA